MILSCIYNPKISLEICNTFIDILELRVHVINSKNYYSTIICSSNLWDIEVCSKRWYRSSLYWVKFHCIAIFCLCLSWKYIQLSANGIGESEGRLKFQLCFRFLDPFPMSASNWTHVITFKKYKARRPGVTDLLSIDQTCDHLLPSELLFRLFYSIQSLHKIVNSLMETHAVTINSK